MGSNTKGGPVKYASGAADHDESMDLKSLATISTTGTHSKASRRSSRNSSFVSDNNSLAFSVYSSADNHSSGSIGLTGNSSSASIVHKMQRRGSAGFSGAHTPASASAITAEGRKRLQELTIDKLRFDRLGLIGRGQETDQLKLAFQEFLERRQRTVVLIGGSAGTGKSHLAAHTLQPLLRQQHAAFPSHSGGYWLTGKHDQQQGDRPYAALSSCCEDFCQQVIANLPADEIAELRTKLRKELGAEGLTLTSILPSLLPLIGAAVDDGDETSSQHSMRTSNHHAASGGASSDGYLQAKLRFTTAFRKFMRVACDLAPTILMIDDLQWCDESSFQLMESLLKDFENDRLMIVGTYRPEAVDETDETHLFVKFRKELRQAEDVHLDTMVLGNLTLEATVEIIVELLSTQPDKATPLAELVFNKTHGNAFFTVQFLTILQQRKLLEYNFGKLSWTWDLEKIDQSMLATENVADLVRAKMESLPAELRRILPLMGSLGASFSFTLFQFVLEFMQTQQDNNNHSLLESSSSLFSASHGDEILAVCVEEGLMEKHQGSTVLTYRWIHDKVQEAALRLIPADQLLTMQFAFALHCLDQMNESQIDDHIFVLVHLLRAADAKLDYEDPKRREIAKLRLKSGLQAFQSSAFFQAALELGAGIELLPPGSWTKDYDLCLELFSTAAEAHLCIGEVDAMDGFVDEILRRTKNKPILDRRRAYDAKARGYMANGQPEETGQLLCQVLEQLGVKFPRLVGGIAQTLWKLTKAQKHADEITKNLAELPPVQDEIKEWTISLLAYLAASWYYTENPLMPLAVLKGLEVSLKVGISSVTPETVAMVGLLCTVGLKDAKAGQKYAEQAVQLLENMDSKASEAKTLFIINDFVLHYTKPIEPCKKGLLRGHYAGMSNGDSEYGCWNICGFLEQGFSTGSVLDSLIRDCREYTLEARELKQLTSASIMTLLWQAALNLAGKSDNPLIFTGEAMDEETFSKSNSFASAWIFQLPRYKIFVYVIMGEYARATELILQYKMEQHTVQKAFPGLFMVGWLYFHCALASVSMARQSTRRSNLYRKVAKKFATQIKTWAEQGSPNVSHQHALIQAELADLAGDRDEADKCFQTSLLLSARRGFRCDRAMAHERFGDFYARQGDMDSAKYHYNEAITVYTEWGAHAKVEQLREQSRTILTIPFEVRRDASEVSDM